MSTLFRLLVGHCLADYPLQGDFLAKAKNHRAPLPGTPWWIALSAHACLHAGAVAYLTGSPVLTVIEFVVHCGIDWLKCDGRTTFAQDQLLHVVCKVAYVGVLAL